MPQKTATKAEDKRPKGPIMMFHRKYKLNRASVQPSCVPALEGNLRKAAGSGSHPALEGRAAGKSPFTPRATSVGTPHHQTRARETATHRAAPSASLPQGDETQKSVNPTFTAVVVQPSSPAGHRLPCVIPGAGIARSLCSRADVPGHRVRD